MKISEQITFSATNILLSLALLSLSAFYTYPGTAAAEDFSSAKERPLIQYDDDDLAPPVVPDTPWAPQPGDIEDPALSPDSAISEPDPLFDQTAPVIEQPEPEVIEEQPGADDGEDVVNEPGAAVEEPAPLVNGDEAVINEPEPVVEEPEPLVNQAQPIVEQPEPVVPQGEPPGDAEAEGRGGK